MTTAEQVYDQREHLNRKFLGIDGKVMPARTVTSPSDIKPFVIVESPYAGDIARNIAFARACVRDSLMRGEAPFASHLLYTQPGILRDEVLEERELGMSMGWHIMRRAGKVCPYVDLGWSSGMRRGVEAARLAGIFVEERRLGPLDTWLDNYHAAKCGLLPTMDTL